jgi:prolyl 4-hydroxylase
MYAGHLDLTQPLVWTVDDALPPSERAAYIDRVRAGEAEIAPIIGKHGGAEVDLAVRNNTRVMWDDAEEANSLLARVSARVPQRLSGMQLAGANPRLRLYRYGPGEKHGAHWDTVVELSGGVRSSLSYSTSTTASRAARPTSPSSRSASPRAPAARCSSSTASCTRRAG